MSKNKNYTKEQKHLIKQCMIDADIIGLGKQETIDYVKSRLNLNNFSEGSYKKYRSEILNNNDNDDSNVQWISYYARKGFVEFYRKRISEMEMIQKETLSSILKKKPYEWKDGKKQKNGDRKTIWKGIKLKERWKKIDNVFLQQTIDGKYNDENEDDEDEVEDQEDEYKSI